MTPEIVDLCGGDLLCTSEATHVVALDEVNPNVRPLKLCAKHKDELVKRCERENVKVVHLIHEIVKPKAGS